KPHGEVVEFDPPFTCCRGRDDYRLRPGKSYHTDIALSYSSDGYPFMEPGCYQVQAVYQGLGPALYSNILQLWVRYPHAGAAKLVGPLFGDRGAAYLPVGGHPALTDAVRLLDWFVHDSGATDAAGNLTPDAHPLAHYYLRCRAMRSVEEAK